MRPGTEAERTVGNCEFDIQGVHFSTMAQPFRFYVLKRVQEAYDSMSQIDQADVAALLASCDMGDLLDLRLSRDIGRANNLEVWL